MPQPRQLGSTSTAYHLAALFRIAAFARLERRPGFRN
jgi:hypothetical protein